METVKKASVAGQFYTDNKDVLLNQLSEFERRLPAETGIQSRLVIAPHAGYIYSGQLMSESIHYLSSDIRNVFIIAPAHRVPFVGLALSGYERWRTPLGEIEVNQEIGEQLRQELSASYNDAAFAPEHAVEVEVPILQRRFGTGVKIIPVLVGQAVPGKVTEILARFYDNPENGFIISSDLSHFLTWDQAKKLDAITAQMIESGDIHGFRPGQACGAIGICGAVEFARQRGWSFIRGSMCNSGDITGDRDRVVGYGSWFLYEGNETSYLKQHCSQWILETARRNIVSELTRHRRLTRDDLTDIPTVMERPGACFVTLEKGGNLRGCIGSVQAHTSLINDLLANSWNAAFGDPRFPPLTREELERTRMDVSLLSPSYPIHFNSEEEMLAQIKPFHHGLIISDQGRRAVFLPSVWKQLPEKEEFLAHLKLKAGMSRDHFSPTFEARLFTTEILEEE